MTILEQLEQKDQFTDIEKFIAEYILAHREEIYGWNLASLAKGTCSSNATIVRMCRKLGFKGYKDFHIAFVVELEKQRREKRKVDFDWPFDQSQGMWDVVKNTAELMKEAVDICYSSIDFPKMLRAAEMIRHAGNLYVYGVGDAYISGLSFANQLTKLGISVIHPMQYYESIAVSATARPTVD